MKRQLSVADTGIQLPPRHTSMCLVFRTTSAQVSSAPRLRRSPPICLLTPCLLITLPPTKDNAADGRHQPQARQLLAPLLIGALLPLLPATDQPPLPTSPWVSLGCPLRALHCSWSCPEGSVDVPPLHLVPVRVGFEDGLPPLPVPVPEELEDKPSPLLVPVLEGFKDNSPPPPLPVPAPEEFGDELPPLPVPVSGELEDEPPPLLVPVSEEFKDKLPPVPVPEELDDELAPLLIPVPEGGSGMNCLQFGFQSSVRGARTHCLHLLSLSSSTADLQGTAADLHSLVEDSSRFCTTLPSHTASLSMAGLLTTTSGTPA
ncbi:hypothetical protein CRENBAI_017690 [Crenichthys baileyi]|uniref:Uncharacterized protein n=1 Tax=Crenichthys baileyi TaxID=28760 RepID=A0AAV9RDJ3_9TELE